MATSTYGQPSSFLGNGRFVGKAVLYGLALKSAFRVGFMATAGFYGQHAGVANHLSSSAS